MKENMNDNDMNIHPQVVMQLDYLRRNAEDKYNKGSRREYENIYNYKEYQKEIDRDGDKNLLVMGKLKDPYEFRSMFGVKPFARRYRGSDLLVHRPGTGGEILVHLEDIDIVDKANDKLKESIDITNEVQRAVDNIMKNKDRYKNQDDLEDAIYSAVANCFSGMHGVTRTTSDMIDDVYEKELKRVGLNTMNETVDISKFKFTNYRNPDGQSHPNCKTYRSTLEYMASETERLFNKCLKTYWGATEPYKQLTTSYMNLNRHSCTRDLVGAGAEQGLKDAQSAIFKRQGELLELSKQFTEWNGKEWVKSELTESNELEQRAKKHKKKSKGMGWHMAVNAGDVEKGIEVFNNSTSLGTSSGEGTAMGEAIESNTYYYNGPIYYRGHKIAEKSDIYTTAKSLNVAIRNVLYKASQGDRDNLYQYDIVDQLVKEIPKEETPQIRPKCQMCGYEINDIGDCPVCDYGEDDLLESLSDLEALWTLKNLD